MRKEKHIKKRQEIIRKKEQTKAKREFNIEKHQEYNKWKYIHLESKLTEETKTMKQKKRKKFDKQNDKGRDVDTFEGQVFRAWTAGR